MHACYLFCGPNSLQMLIQKLVEQLTDDDLLRLWKTGTPNFNSLCSEEDDYIDSEVRIIIWLLHACYDLLCTLYSSLSL